MVLKDTLFSEKGNLQMNAVQYTLVKFKNHVTLLLTIYECLRSRGTKLCGKREASNEVWSRFCLVWESWEERRMGTNCRQTLRGF